jgi:putative restriction endonuclease
VRAWSFYMHSGRNPYAGHAGYDDLLGRWYSYDSDVANHRNVGVGDLIVLRDAHACLGLGFIEDIDQSKTTKRHHRCPECNTSQLKTRTTLSPKYRCTHGHTFDDPMTTEDPVTRYRAEFPLTYLDFDGLTRDDLERLSISRSQQNAIRELDLNRALRRLREAGIFPTFVHGGA